MQMTDEGLDESVKDQGVDCRNIFENSWPDDSQSMIIILVFNLIELFSFLQQKKKRKFVILNQKLILRCLKYFHSLNYIIRLNNIYLKFFNAPAYSLEIIFRIIDGVKKKDIDS